MPNEERRHTTSKKEEDNSQTLLQAYDEEDAQEISPSEKPSPFYKNAYTKLKQLSNLADKHPGTGKSSYTVAELSHMLARHKFNYGANVVAQRICGSEFVVIDSDKALAIELVDTIDFIDSGEQTKSASTFGMMNKSCLLYTSPSPRD
eukprot:TRINITY_DN13143_c0_g1_i1.p4 TRINITY_DN13143_c0_g1~~TRINITY_DN13143_c0_g1_i1.p4  ORF type:complete len:148 (-),score=47.00 TRINITY_DN13143_c0_g1_i1:29-472(-)